MGPGRFRRAMQPVLRVRVEFLGPFEFDFRTTSTEVVLASPATIQELVEVLASRVPAARGLWRSLRDETAARRRYYCVSLDHTVLAPEAVLDTPLHDGARVCFAMPMVGG